jgi:hypothetical protein
MFIAAVRICFHPRARCSPLSTQRSGGNRCPIIAIPIRSAGIQLP